MRRLLIASLAAMFAVPAVALANANNYPDKPVRIVVSFPPGTGSDSSARFLAQKLEARFGQPFVVENRPGANSFIAAQTVAKADPDGYTLFVASNSPMATNLVQFKSLPYDPVRDFAPVARLYYGAMVLSVRGDSPYQTVADLVAAAKAHPGKLSYGSGSASYQIATELFMKQAGITAAAIPYKGAAPAVADLAGGQVDFAMSDYLAASALAQSGKTRIIAVGGDKRLPAQPNVPTLQELGYKDYYMVNWVSLFAPAKTPPDVVKKLGDAAVEIFNSKDAAAFVGRTSGQVFAGGADVLRRFQLDEIKRWSNAAALAGIQKE
ncbi:MULTISPECIES: Bug family tripartite tricarboxylate transporter substrate binding protein [unclassified Cupriavidus]|uniref:Bug family tripartite tricarboxylate transporter substrate binding protein n=1 Tax=Cupriavidus sp. H19C3 TaxID=3241603 RepID=UPI003BF893FC